MPPENSNAPGKGASQSSGERAEPNDAKNVAGPRIQLNLEGIPQELRGLRHWVAWRWTPPKKPGGKFGKVPIDPHTGSLASTTDLRTWGTLEDALARMQKDALGGAGFVFTDSGYTGTDLDHCRDPGTGAIVPDAQEIIDRIASYSELSPSGTGVHTITRGKLPGRGRRRGNVEIYDTGRFFTFTGVPVPGAPTAVLDRQDVIAELYAELDARGKRVAGHDHASIPGLEDLDDDELVRRAGAAKNGAKFRALWDGSTEAYSSASEADLALCCLLAFRTRCNESRIDRLFRMSGLFRPKWDEQHGEQTYGEMTIERAVSFTRSSGPKGIDETSEDAPFGVSIRLTDTGNSERLVERFGPDVRHCYPWKKWLAWDGKRWLVDERGALMAMSKRVARSIHSEAEACDDPKLREAISTWANTSERAERRKAMVDLAKSEDCIPILPSQLDQHPLLLNCPNGTLDLATGELREHRREDYLTKLCPTRYTRGAPCPRFLEFLAEILPDPEIQQYVQRFCGYALTGDVSEQVIVLAVGGGLNGKSTLFCALQEVIGGGYSIQISTDLLLAKDRSSHPTELADLFGVRFAIGTETPRGQELNETLVKLLTGGESIRARRMREDFWEFQPTHKLLLVTNYMPKVSLDSFAMLRRLHVVNFEVRIQPHLIDKGLPRKLRAEREGMFAWCVEGRKAWKERGLDPPPEVRFQPTPEAASRRRPVLEFIDTVVVRQPGARTRATTVYAAFGAWCERESVALCTQHEFGAELGNAGFRKRKTEGVMVYLDMALAGPTGPIQGPPGTNGDHSPVDPLGTPHEASNAREVPEGPRRSPEQCRGCGGTRRWRRSAGTDLFCISCVPPATGVQVHEVIDTATGEVIRREELRDA